MRYSLIMAGGSGTRLWPMSRRRLPKQLIPLFDGKSLLQLADQRLEGLIPAQRRYVCAGEEHAGAIRDALPGLDPRRFLGEPIGRDTLNAVGFAAAVVAREDPDATIGVFTADHLIRPVDRFQAILDEGFALAERRPQTLVAFGVAPTWAATSYGYPELGEVIEGSARVVERFKEKPDEATAKRYLAAGPSRHLWNSGMFVWRAATLLECIRRYEPASHVGLARIAAARGGSGESAVLAEVYPGLKKISVDFAVMEPASRDPAVQVAAIPMSLDWLDVGSWPVFAQTRPRDERGNAAAAARSVLVDAHNTLVASSDPGHLIAAVGCDDLLIVHTPDATLVCRADRAEEIKSLYGLIGERFGGEYL